MVAGTRAGRYEEDPVESGYTVDCAECVMRETAACDDCVVSFVVSREPGEALVIDVTEARAMRLLSRAGLVPDLRHTPRVAGE
jgi:hypothetical protein